MVDVLNLKCEKDMAILLKDGKTILPAYHMNKKNWISILLEEASDEMVLDLIAQSYELTL
ncbi:YyaQ [Campylobacter hyointestinalis subsp. hyointestinalis]|uniref:YyaQ n=1 Tax=Campylobacter hyointestinalis subsp. hyointestinalis TaxID=91352 RepID=A0A9W5EPD0_CAMHY|nr:MmcQ/YjbR family DNA-binding protein [Campylobacter hyointestinalis]CUU70466.1 YyaQ [Campylobacter hyointestinalis subsp. hyointestinalis]